MLLKPDYRLEKRCPRRFHAVAAVVVLSIIGLASAVRLEAQEAPKSNASGAAKKESEPTEAITYRCRVAAAETGAPIAGATVTIERELVGDARYPQNKTLQETTHKTNESGYYSFTLPPDQVAERYLYLKFNISHPEYAPRKGFGYALGMIRKNEKLGGRPFFEITKLYTGKTITGAVVTPDGKPAANVPIHGYTFPGEKPYLEDARKATLTITGSFEDSKTDEHGRFHLMAATPGHGGFWLQPTQYAPVGFVAAPERGDVGTIRLKDGLRIKGQVLDSGGKPVAGIQVSGYRRDQESPEVDAFNRISMAVGGYFRTATTDAAGRFELAPVEPGMYEFRVQDNHNTQPLPKYSGVFVTKTLSITKNKTDLKVQAVPTVEIRVRNVDATGRPKRGFEFHVFGRLKDDDSEWFGGLSDRPTSGLCTAKVPKGLRNVQIQFSDNEHGSFLVRRSPGAKPEHIREIRLDQLDKDLEGIDVIRYKAPILLVKAVDEKGNAIPGLQTTATIGGASSEESEANVRFNWQPDGRWRSVGLIPEAEVHVSVKAPQWKPSSQTVTLREGEVRELAFTMIRDPADRTGAAKALKAIQEDQQKIAEKYNQAYATAKTDPERENIFKARRKEIQECVRRALQLAKDHPDDSAAFDARVWIVTGGLGYFPETWQALDHLREHEFANPKLAVVCRHARIYRDSYAETEDFLRSVIKQNPDHTVQGIAVFYLAVVLQDYAHTAEALKDPEKAKRWGSWLPPQLAQRLRASAPEKLRRESEELYQRAADRYGDVKSESGRRTLRSWAESALFELRNLQVGKVAPEIEGEDIDGKKLRLSDYRGKVVVLDFWGHW
jgi:uncharacterized GH25 family protein